ncbi:MAG: PadR family transcriptional regulator [Rectinemataceae bacterium]|jgi:DNA-binding PadR family transcriptional regulator
MSLKHGILGLLTYSPMSGYDLMKAFNQSLKFFWSAQTSQIYRELESLAASGWIETAGESQRGHMVKTVFAITVGGRQELNRWLRDKLEKRERERSPFLLRLFFGSFSGVDSIRELAESRKTQAENNAAELRQVLETVIPARRTQTKDELAAFCWSQAAEYGLAQFEAEIRWAEACLAKIGAYKGNNR